jgi:methylthioribose-1-phosphate isomerase
MIKTLYWEHGSLYILNQLLLPRQVTYVRCNTYQQVAHCIKDMIIRGAPAIGVAAAYGMALAVKNKEHIQPRMLNRVFSCAKKILAATRPTAINLFWALNEVEQVYIRIQGRPSLVPGKLLAAAHHMYHHDIATNKSIGAYGAKLLRKNSILLTHCNAGSLATAGWGTALGVIHSAFLQGKVRIVYVDETRPYLQGARLTAWELCANRIPCALITDNMAAHIIKSEKVDAIIVGADRIAANGDTANKIGTYGLGVLARYHRIPLYVAAPISTFDVTVKSGNDIPIEERSTREVTHIGNVCLAPEHMTARHPAFDVTPANLIAAIITERGVIHKPTTLKIKKLFGKIRNSKSEIRRNFEFNVPFIHGKNKRIKNS